MKNVTTKAILLAWFIGLAGISQAQNATKKAKEGEVKVFIVKDENGKRTEIKESFSPEDKEKIDALLKEYDVKLSMDDLKAKSLEEGQAIRIEMEVEEESDGEQVKRDVHMVRISKDDSSALHKVRELKLDELSEGQMRKIIKLKDEAGNVKVMVMDGDELKGGEEKFFETKEGQHFVIQTEDHEVKVDEDGNKITEFKTMVFITKDGKGAEKLREKMPTEVEFKEVESTPIQDFKLFPNPTNGNFSMQFKTEQPTDVQLNITDAKGAMIFQKDLAQFKGSFQEDYDLSKEKSGLYFFTISSEGQKVSQKILVQ
ncbi:MAG: T9SS type A sorting domain-containing protein [Vicingaceae bacterium]